MDWFKKHADMIFILGIVVSSMIWMNFQFNKVNERINDKFSDVNERITSVSENFNNKLENLNNKLNEIDKDLAILKTILIMKGVIPESLIGQQTEGK